jgi:hypothetical protein
MRNLDSAAIRISHPYPPTMSTRKWTLDGLLIISAGNSVLARTIRDYEDWLLAMVVLSNLRFEAFRSLSSQSPLPKLLIFKVGV